MILVTGSRGVIGSSIVQKLITEKQPFMGTRREAQQESTHYPEVVVQNSNIQVPEDQEIKMVLHVANAYKTSLTDNDICDVFNTNVGMALSISKIQHERRIPVVALGSFLEKAPEPQQPWSYYVASKLAAKSILFESADHLQTPLTYLYLYDTYSKDTRRRKFIDIVVEALSGQQTIQASYGNQKQRLTHVDDIVAAVWHFISHFDYSRQVIQEFQITSDEVFSLREIVELAERKFNKPLDVVWGALGYRRNEVFELWNSAAPIPNWKPHWKLEQFFEDLATLSGR